ncbi:MAG: pentapeptide repeat-containing protein [Myxococcota bacterium]|nr:pentapeptide repeat-containing protein [Myxococcota bacterium]
MKSSTIIPLFIFGCQVSTPPPEEILLEEVEEALDGAESHYPGLSLPDHLVCATRPFERDFTGKPYVYRFEILNVYGQAATNFDLHHLHPSEASPSFIQMYYQDSPTFTEDSIHLVFSSDNMLAGDPEIFSHQQDANATLELIQQESGFFVGTLSTFQQFTLEAHCWVPDQEREFQYNESNGACENADGDGGMNPFSLIQVRETENAECTVLEADSLNEGDYHHPNLPWNLRGAVLHAGIHFADMIDADFRGADLSELDFGYTKLRGPVDDFTALPEGCEVQEGLLDCIR